MGTNATAHLVNASASTATWGELLLRHSDSDAPLEDHVNVLLVNVYAKDAQNIPVVSEELHASALLENASA